MLAFVSSGILGQYDPFAPNGGELLLVYPNVIAVERQLRVLPADFRLWVCLHEVTHRVQFRANPWLADHMKQALAVLTEDVGEDIAEVIGRLGEFVRNRRDGVAAEPNSAGIIGLLRAVQSEPQRRALDQLLVLGTLLEGHADHVMDAVGPAVVPSVAVIRRRFNERRSASSRRCSGWCGRCWVSTPSSASTPAARRSSTMWCHGSGWPDSTRSGPAPKHCRCQRKSTSRNDGSTGSCSHVAHGGRRIRQQLTGSSDERWCVALSGGPDSLALTAVAATTAADHGADRRSRAAAGFAARSPHTAREQALALGCVDAQVLCVDVGTAGGPEAAAPHRPLRVPWTAPAAMRRCCSAHTLDDQAETVLLGLGRGSGARSIAGMRPYDPPWAGPLLGIRRAVTHAACAELGLEPWHDPHNADRRFTRTRLRTEVLPLLEEVLGGGVAEALARTATALREDTDTLDELAQRALETAVTGDGLDTGRLAELPEAIRRRVIRSWLLAGGASDLTDKQIRGVDTLVTSWRGQGGVAVGSPLRSQRLIAGRRDGVLTLHREPV